MQLKCYNLLFLVKDIFYGSDWVPNKTWQAILTSLHAKQISNKSPKFWWKKRETGFNDTNISLQTLSKPLKKTRPMNETELCEQMFRLGFPAVKCYQSCFNSSRRLCSLESSFAMGTRYSMFFNSIALLVILDPIKTAQGSLSLKAYRLTPKLMEICKEKDFTPEWWVAHSESHNKTLDGRKHAHMGLVIICAHIAW